mmetsp:Transcript_5305/g.7863  ORF Transcript_5305/g.7863 Transcript_5305/m.7863 type:complete len:250 (-) Transcript_5305:131-880(-)
MISTQSVRFVSYVCSQQVVGSLFYSKRSQHSLKVLLFASLRYLVLSLAGDQVNKLMINTRGTDTTITALHLDECEQQDLTEIMALIKNLCDTSTLFIFSSPQCITEKFPFFAAALVNEGLIKFVVLDEVHLCTHFGRTFRNEFNDLMDGLFSKLSSTMPMLFLTATCTQAIDTAFQTMISKSITHCEWPNLSIMSLGNRRTVIQVSYSSRPYMNMFKSIAAAIQTEPVKLELSKNVMVYSNAKQRIQRI